jgi:hypothetical protein
MKIRITAGGIYGRRGEIPVGTEIEVMTPLPAGWAGRYEVVTGDPKPEAQPVTNREPDPTPHPLDHDGDGKPGGSLPGKESTAAKGAARRRKKKGR